jgi:hypothetical protein
MKGEIPMTEIKEGKKVKISQYCTWMTQVICSEMQTYVCRKKIGTIKYKSTIAGR